MNTNRIEYIDEYNKENYKMFPFRVRVDNVKVMEKLNSVPSRNAYILSLIENDINPPKSVTRERILTIKQIKEILRPIMQKHGIKDVYLFGSYSRGEATEDSDVDIYCDMGDVDTLFKAVAFDEELEEALGKKVDVITIGSTMHDFFRKRLEEDMIKLW